MKYMHLMGMSKKELHNYLNGKVHYQPKLRKHYYDTVTAQQEEEQTPSVGTGKPRATGYPY
jgi:hypothetical protein